MVAVLGNVHLTKNKTTSLKRLLQILALLVFAMTWLNSANASFLCVGSDGHTAVENIYSSACHQTDFDDQSNTFEINSQHDCTDTLLFSNAINPSYKNFKNIELEYSPITNFIRTDLALVVINQPYLSVPFIQIDNKPRIFTDSIRLII